MERTEKQIGRTEVARRLIIRPEAETEVQQAFEWYQDRSLGLGLEFLRSVEACVKSMVRNPFSYTVAKVPNVRRALVRRFPFAIFYLVDDDAVVVIAVFNVKRQPIDWKKRV